MPVLLDVWQAAILIVWHWNGPMDLNNSLHSWCHTLMLLFSARSFKVSFTVACSAVHKCSQEMRVVLRLTLCLPHAGKETFRRAAAPPSSKHSVCSEVHWNLLPVQHPQDHRPSFLRGRETEIGLCGDIWSLLSSLPSQL